MVLETSLVRGEALGPAKRELELLRVSAWGEKLQDQSVLDRFRFDRFDHVGWHRLLRNQAGELIAASRFCLIENGDTPPDEISFAPVLGRIRYPAVFLNRSVVRCDHRGKGLWRRMIGKNVNSSLALNPIEIWSESSGGRIDYLISLGFEMVSASADKEVPGSYSLLRYSLVGAARATEFPETRRV